MNDNNNKQNNESSITPLILCSQYPISAGSLQINMIENTGSTSTTENYNEVFQEGHTTERIIKIILNEKETSGINNLEVNRSNENNLHEEYTLEPNQKKQINTTQSSTEDNQTLHNVDFIGSIMFSDQRTILVEGNVFEGIDNRTECQIYMKVILPS